MKMMTTFKTCSMILLQCDLMKSSPSVTMDPVANVGSIEKVILKMI
jgi:hypothetical protein